MKRKPTPVENHPLVEYLLKRPWLVAFGPVLPMLLLTVELADLFRVQTQEILVNIGFLLVVMTCAGFSFYTRWGWWLSWEYLVVGLYGLGGLVCLVSGLEWGRWWLLPALVALSLRGFMALQTIYSRRKILRQYRVVKAKLTRRRNRE